MSKVFVLGIDGAPPQYVFDKWLDELPNLKKLMDSGAYARIITTVPPSTCSAWPSFFSGKDASQHSIYSYTVRDGFSYTSSRLINSKDVKTEMIWDVLGRFGKKCIIMNVPVTYPIEKEYPNCLMISDFLTPEFNEKSMYPKSFFEEIKKKIPDYMFDVNVGLASYKKEGNDELIEKVYKMTQQSFDIIFDCLKHKEWEMFGAVIIGSDRLEHHFWSYFDETHRYYKGENPYKDVLKDYFIYLDKQLGKILALLPEDTTIIVSSDHGMDKMNCRFNMNDWLIKEGYLVLKKSITKPVKLDMADVDWSKTKAYSVGAYFGRIYFNLEGREPEGIVPIDGYTLLQQELVDKIKLIKDDVGNDMDTKIYLPQEIYSGDYSEEAPDIMIYFDNLLCGVNNDVGNEGFYTWETTKGSDDAGHAPEGAFVISGSNIPHIGDFGWISIYDVAPIIYRMMDVHLPKDVVGKVVQWLK